MDGLVDDIVGIVHSLDCREGVIKVRLLDLLAMTIDVMEALYGVYGDKVGCYPDMGSVLFVQLSEPEMTVAVESMVELNKGGDGCKEGAGERP